MTVFGCAIFGGSTLLDRATAHGNAEKTVAFYYGPTPPLEDMVGIDMVILEPDHVARPEVALQLAAKRRQALFAYVSIGEINVTRNYFAQVPRQTLRTENKNWGSWIVDQTSPLWREFLLTSIIEPLWRQGWRGFFLDTLDSYQLFAKTDLERERQRQALVETIKYLKARHPDANLIFNRGFELLPDVSQFVHAVAAESLYRGYDAVKGQYGQVTPSDRAWLTAQLANARDRYGLPAIAIDYVSPTGPDTCAETMNTASLIRAAGFIPWVTDVTLNSLVQLRCPS
ncbi:hypothetical protein HAV22_21445 [Massilia sp. TW-1]|uniref:Glycoside-hydrolase family GH114 TIM-barrel domain-containing protein n=2 Tax=Telluria antibiotica TaxID=2717319 RepID=A0ABX0PJQ5_9BURK|nr:hypothetical protein [Telluria antibiotica]